MNREPIRHHYIPQFILKNFCFNHKGQINYFNKNTSKTIITNVKEIFMEKNLYRDEKNFVDNPTKIEKDLAAFECEVARIIKEKFLCLNKIILTMEENEKLKLFFAIMGFRSSRVASKFSKNTFAYSKSIYNRYQKDNDFSDLWKRNLGYIANCRSLNEVLNHELVDDPFKIFMMRDTYGFFGKYFCILERRDETQQFIITDTYPTFVSGIATVGELHLYNIFPISPDRVILVVSNGAKNTPRDVIFFREFVLNEPKVNHSENTITICTKKLYSEEVKYINSILAKEAQEGWVFR